jgi:trehalose 6-phosphate synthase/phosphatase
MSRRLLIVSNRLPIAARPREGALHLVESAGGLATGLRGWHERSSGLWIGWPGDVSRLSAPHRAELDRRLAARRIVPVALSAEEVHRYYEGFANAVLWPLCHYLLDRVPLDTGGWDAYQQVNEKFAAAVARQYRPGDLIWVHDYQLMLVPRLIRDRVPDATIGFFLHIPFPALEVFRILPWRRELLEGMLGADLIGFHTYTYLDHFVSALQHLLDLEPDGDRVLLPRGFAHIGCFAMGIDASRFQELARDPAVDDLVAQFRAEASGRKILLGVDRLDYTKGIPRRLIAFQRLLERAPELRERVRLIQVAVPSRTRLESYQGFRKQVDELVGRINGAVGTLNATPIRYLFQSVNARQLTALYRAADVMLVTPLRDGMNLVAKEFVASRIDEDGVLVLSEFAGAVAELGEAVIVNPYDIEALASAIEQALAMPADERGARMRALRGRVLSRTVQWWADRFVGTLTSLADRRTELYVEEPRPAQAILDQLREAPAVVFLLDCDGTLLPFAPAPDLVRPDAEVLSLIERLAARHSVHVISGRPRETLESWFSGLPVSLWAEHGLWSRPPGSDRWRLTARPAKQWLARTRRILEQFTAVTAGSFIEEKSASLVWHYRMTPPEIGARQARDLRLLLKHLLQDQPAQVMQGNCVIEIRPTAANKGSIVQTVLERHGPDAVLIAIGDDRTDEDMFTALPETGIGIRVGSGATAATYRLEDLDAVRRFLGEFLLNPSGARLE